MKNKTRKGFTLIELLVVIAIIAVLAVVVILSLNPAELLRQARDSNRVSDMATLKSAISLWQADVATSSAVALGAANTLYSSLSASTNTLTYTQSTSSIWWGFVSTVTTVNQSSSRNIDGTGWVPINFNLISSGSPIGSLPVDPSNNATNTIYVYYASTTVFKLATKTESVKYSTGGTSDVETSDGGNSTSTFEGGTKPSL